MKLPQHFAPAGIAFSPSLQSRQPAQPSGAERAGFVNRANEAGFASGRQTQQVSCQNELN